jgi:transcriptional regulator with XRE-family HTH domain
VIELGGFVKTGVFICELRKSKGISQEELGSMLHVTKKAVSRWETGRGLPDASILVPLSEILEVSVDEILKGEFMPQKDIDEENLRKIEKMNAVFEYLVEKKLLQKMLVVYAPIVVTTVFSRIRIYQLLNMHDMYLESMAAAVPSYDATVFLLLLFFIASVMLAYRLLRLLIARKKMG